MRTRAIIVSIAAIAIAATAAPDGFADGDEKTRIEITRLSATKIKRTIESSKASCEKGRHVQIFRMDGFIAHKVDRGDAQSDGDWKFSRELQPGTYFAKVDSKPGCRYDVSPQKTLR